MKGLEIWSTDPFKNNIPPGNTDLLQSGYKHDFMFIVKFSNIISFL